MGMEGQILRSIYNRAGSFAQPGTHFFLMFVFAVILMELLASQASAKAVRNTICISLGFAVSMELLQSVLPESFSRACDPLDLLPSLAGAICGSVFGFVIHLYSNKGKT